MSKSQFILISIGVGLVIVLSILPKAVVDNDKGSVNASTTETDTLDNTTSHVMVSSVVQQEIDSLKTIFINAPSLQSLSKLIDIYKTANRYDSAAFYAADYAKQFPDELNQTKAGDLYYEAFTYALDQKKAALMAENARDLYNKILAKNPKNLDLKTKIGMTYIASQNPMQGVLMIREVLQEDPKNEFALFNLGVLSMQSGQFKKALDRFKKLLEVNPQNIEAKFQLAVCYFELGQEHEAVLEFNAVKQMKPQPEVLQTVNAYLEKLKDHNHDDHE